MEDNNFERVYKIIFEVLEKGKRMEQMVQELVDLLGISIVLMDILGQEIVSAYTNEFSKRDDKSEACWDMKGSSNGKIEVINGDKILRVIGPVKVKDNLEGVCITYHKAESGEEFALKLNQLICRTLSVRLKWNGNYGYVEENMVKQIISRALLGNENDENKRPEINERVYQNYVPAPYIVAVVQQSKADEYQIRKRIREQFPETLVYIEDKKMRILFVDVNKEGKKNDIYRLLNEMIEKEAVKCAVSEVFDEINQIKRKQKILSRIIYISSALHKENELMKEYDYYLELLCSYAYEEIGGESYCYNQLAALEKEDKEKGTEFCKSLKAYLLSGNNVNLAAKTIFVHRNTMVYRLSKIHEIMQLDINDPYVAKRLLLSMILKSFSDN